MYVTLLSSHKTKSCLRLQLRQDRWLQAPACLVLLQLPDYVVVCVCPLTGLTRVSHEHLAVALALEVPVACVVTKADIAPPEALEQVLQDLR